MQQWADIRRRVLVEGVSKRQILRETGMHWRTLEKVLANPEPPGYRAKAPRPRPKLGPFRSVILNVRDPVCKWPQSRTVVPAHPTAEVPGREGPSRTSTHSGRPCVFTAPTRGAATSTPPRPIMLTEGRRAHGSFPTRPPSKPPGGRFPERTQSR